MLPSLIEFHRNLDEKQKIKLLWPITVRQAFSAEDVAFALDLSRREDWIMGEEDIELSHAAFPDGFFVGAGGAGRGESVPHQCCQLWRR